MDTLKSIRTLDEDKIDIINQLLLPHTIEYVQIQTIEHAHDAIKSMKVCLFIFRRLLTHERIDSWCTRHRIPRIAFDCDDPLRRGQGDAAPCLSGFPILA